MTTTTDLQPCLHEPNTPVVVTGGVSGIGLGCANALAAVGRPLALWDLDDDRCREVAAELSARYDVPAVGVGVDLRRADAIAPALQRTHLEFPAIGGLVHAAGVVMQQAVDELTAEDWDSVLNVNLRALALMVRALLADLRAQAGSAVVGIASINATLGSGLIPAYTASKGGMLSLVRSLADSLAADDIRINAVSPGQILTPMIKPIAERVPGLFERRILLGRLGTADEVGRVVRFLLSNEATYVTAAEIVVDGGNISSQR
jgi:NAD(P)-dependent dehydrogenase (short-subunit alcohol dehydrogenase family)